jgi:hypothetical protein
VVLLCPKLDEKRNYYIWVTTHPQPMIKFFRKIRQNLLLQNKTGKYFKYAIGEIVLVVIGILIALSINNWNEKRKTIVKVDQILKKVTNELVFNIKRSQDLVNYYRAKEKGFYSVLHKKATLEDYKTNKLTYLVWGSKAIRISDDAANKLEGISDELTSKQDSLISKINTFYKIYKVSLDNEDKSIARSVDFMNDRLHNNTDWFYMDNLEKGLPERAYQYFLNNPLYLNDVANYELRGLRFQLPRAIEFTSIGRNLYIELAKHLNLEINTKIAPNKTNFKHYVGIYKEDHTRKKETYTIKEDNGKLILSWVQNESPFSRSFYPTNEDEFTLFNKFGKLKRDAKNKVIGFTITLGSIKPRHYIKIE